MLLHAAEHPGAGLRCRSAALFHQDASTSPPRCRAPIYLGSKEEVEEIERWGQRIRGRVAREGWAWLPALRPLPQESSQATCPRVVHHFCCLQAEEGVQLPVSPAAGTIVSTSLSSLQPAS